MVANNHSRVNPGPKGDCVWNLKEKKKQESSRIKINCVAASFV